MRISIESKLLPVVFTPGRLNISFKNAAFTLARSLEFGGAAKNHLVPQVTCQRAEKDGPWGGSCNPRNKAALF